MDENNENYAIELSPEELAYVNDEKRNEVMADFILENFDKLEEIGLLDTFTHLENLYLLDDGTEPVLILIDDDENSLTLEDLYQIDSNLPKISINGIVKLISDYAGIKSEQMSGKEYYAYRDLQVYKELISEMMYKSHLNPLLDPAACKPLTSKTPKEKLQNIQITNTTLPGLVSYVIFLTKSSNFYKYHKLYKSSKNDNIKGIEKILYELYIDRVMHYIHDINMTCAKALDCFDAIPDICNNIKSVDKTLKTNISFDQGKKLEKDKQRLIERKRQCIETISTILDYKLTFNDASSSSGLNSGKERIEKKLKALSTFLLPKVMSMIELFDKAMLNDERALVLNAYRRISTNPKLEEYIKNANKEQLQELISKLDGLKNFVDEIV